MQIRHQEFGNQQRHEQDYRHAPREICKEVAKHACHCQQKREKGDRYSQSCRKDGFEKFSTGSQCRRHPVNAFRYQLHIIVYDDNGIIDYHPERHDKTCKRDRIQFNVESIEKAKRYEYGYRNRRRRYQSHL